MASFKRVGVVAHYLRGLPGLVAALTIIASPSFGQTVSQTPHLALNPGLQNLDSKAKDVRLKINRSGEVSFQTRQGNVYDLQWSADNQTWKSSNEFYFGDDSRVVDATAARREPGVRQRFFRVKVLDAADVGHGPVSLAGNSYVFNDGSALRVFTFLDSTTGVLGSAEGPTIQFRYDFHKSGPAEGKLRLLFGDQEESHTLAFETVSAGSFEIKHPESGDVDRNLSGTFTRLVPSKTSPGTVGSGDEAGVPAFGLGDASPAEALASVIGHSFLFYSEGQRGLIRVMNASYVKESMLNRSSSFRYEYSVEGASAYLTVWKGHEKYDHYELDFLNSMAGSFRRSQYVDAQLTDADMGVFSIFGGSGVNLGLADELDAAATIHFPSEEPGGEDADTPKDEDPENECELPKDLVRLCLEMTAGKTKEKFSFYSDDAGHVVEPLRGTTMFVPFDYSYSKTGDRTATLTVEFSTADGKETIEFKLSLNDECSGVYQRRDLKGGKEVGKSNGSFTMRAELILPDPQRPGQAIILANPNAVNPGLQTVRTQVVGQ